MTQHPAVVALLLASAVVTAMTLYAAANGLRILHRWNPGSGSAFQLLLERRTSLLSTLVGFALLVEAVSLLLFLFTADDVHDRFAGAMCAAGTLQANAYGYPALMLKVAVCIVAGVWLILNHADARGYDYPLIRVKYVLLALLAPLVAAEGWAQFAFFTRLRPDIITSCCGSLFAVDRPTIGGELAALPYRAMRAAFFGSVAATTASGALFLRRGRGAPLVSVLGVATAAVGAAALVSFICLYFYEVPTHHCPFCVLQREYAGVGYLIHTTLLGGAVTSLGIGVLHPFRRRPSIARVVPQLQRRLTGVALGCYVLLAAVVAARMLTTSFRLE